MSGNWSPLVRKQNGNYKGSEENRPWLPELLAELEL